MRPSRADPHRRAAQDLADKLKANRRRASTGTKYQPSQVAIPSPARTSGHGCRTRLWTLSEALGKSSATLVPADSDIVSTLVSCLPFVRSCLPRRQGDLSWSDAQLHKSIQCQRVLCPCCCLCYAMSMQCSCIVPAGDVMHFLSGNLGAARPCPPPPQAGAPDPPSTSPDVSAWSVSDSAGTKGAACRWQ